VGLEKMNYFYSNHTDGSHQDLSDPVGSRSNPKADFDRFFGVLAQGRDDFMNKLR
jgi:hypothetical protein